ncbi:MAG: SpoIIE family protein phosphatase [Eubacteriales bacterium]
MTNKTEAAKFTDAAGKAAASTDSAPVGSLWGAESAEKTEREQSRSRNREKRGIAAVLSFLSEMAEQAERVFGAAGRVGYGEDGSGGGIAQTPSQKKRAEERRSETKRQTERAFRRAVRSLVRRAAVILAAFFFSGAILAYEAQPIGIAWVCAAAGAALPAAAAGVLLALLCGSYGEGAGLYTGALLLAVGVRYAAGRFLCEGEGQMGFGSGRSGHRGNHRTSYEDDPDDADSRFPDNGIPGEGNGTAVTAAGLLARLGRAVFPSGVFAQTTGMRVGISVLSACPIAAGLLLGTAETAKAVCASGFVLCIIPAFTWLFCGIFDRGRSAPAHREGGIGALCYALTASVSGIVFFGFSLRFLCAHALTLYISKKGGYLRGGLCGLICGFACDVLYAPAYALIGAVSGLLWNIHTGPAVLFSLFAGSAYAVYVGAFSAIRSVIPEMIAVTAIAYPAARYLPAMLKKIGIAAWFTEDEARTIPPCTKEDDDAVTPEQLGMPGLAEQLDTLSGILNGLSATFYHLSDRQKKPGLYEIRQLCETTADRYCAHCAHHNLCWEKEFSSTADAMGRITLCIHRKGRAEAGAAFAPLDRRCPNLQKMLAAMNDAAAVLCEEKITKDKTEVAAADYEGMAGLLRASAAETAHACEKDTALSKRLGRAMGRMGFCARDVAVYGKRRRTVVARGIDLGFVTAGEGARGFPVGRTPTGMDTLLGTEELREAFSALAGVRYGAPEYSLWSGGAELVMTMHACPKVSVKSGCWGEKKAGEEVTGDVLTLFANRSDCFYALVCDGMGSGREASVTAQISTLFLEKLLSVSCAKGAALNLLNGYLRSRCGECSATVDLCEIDMITGEAHFVKCGAAASYLLRGDSMFRIASSTMPLGILREVSAEETAFMLDDGDLLLFFSDGVCGECEDASWIPAEIKRAKEEYARRKARERYIREDARAEVAADDSACTGGAAEQGGPSANERREKQRERLLGPLDYIARSVGEAAKTRIGRQDDMTVIAVEIEMEEVKPGESA